MIEPIFKEGDYVINRDTGDFAIVKGVTKKGYYQFKTYYDAMIDIFKDLKTSSYELQINYQKFFNLCTEEEKKKFNDLIKEKGEK